MVRSRLAIALMVTCVPVGIAFLAITSRIERFQGANDPVRSGQAGVAGHDSAPEPAKRLRDQTVKLRRGDNLVRALARTGVERRVGASIAAALAEHGANLRRVQPGDALEITWSMDGRPIALRYEPSPWLGFAVVESDEGWKVRRQETPPKVRVEAVSGAVAGSLFHAIDRAGESAQLVLDFVEIFSSDFDFTAETRNGDRFRMLVEKRYAGETFVDYGRVLVAQYVTSDDVLTGVAYRTASSFGYYDASGGSLRKSFLKSPLEFTRITSGFTYARPHPILGGVRPHLAIDYAAPVGTPAERSVSRG